jgi:3-isopropylmalate/(R)-2-methylmalate dehydratase small subunit
MKQINIIRGCTAPYPGNNVDTDEIIPARFLYRFRKDGFAETLFHDLRLDEDGSERPDFILNQPNYRDPAILVAGRNFGCGSSREHAVWALQDRGISCVIAASFGDIFKNNSYENGLLAIELAEANLSKLREAIEKSATCEMTVDLPHQTITGPGNLSVSFEIDPGVKAALIDGHSGIDTTLTRLAEIETFVAAYRTETEWAFRR